MPFVMCVHFIYWNRACPEPEACPFLARQLRSPVFISQVLRLQVDYQTLLTFFLLWVLGIQIPVLMTAGYDNVNYQLDRT